MNEQGLRNVLFKALKQILKVQGLHYEDLAELLGVSEATVKRLFQDQDCKLSRLMEVCEALSVRFQDLLEFASKGPVESTVLSLETEKALLAKPGLVSFFMLLVSDIDQAIIEQHNNLKPTDTYLYLRELEELGLIRIGRNQGVHFLVQRPIKWRLDGPLHSVLVKVNQQFIRDTLSEHGELGYPFHTASRLFSEHSIKQLNEEVDQLYQRFQQQAALDQMFYPTEQLSPYKMVSTLAPFELTRYFKVSAFKKDDR